MVQCSRCDEHLYPVPKFDLSRDDVAIPMLVDATDDHYQRVPLGWKQTYEESFGCS